jgi:hypothetical protein
MQSSELQRAFGAFGAVVGVARGVFAGVAVVAVIGFATVVAGFATVVVGFATAVVGFATVVVGFATVVAGCFATVVVGFATVVVGCFATVVVGLATLVVGFATVVAGFATVVVGFATVVVGFAIGLFVTMFGDVAVGALFVVVGDVAVDAFLVIVGDVAVGVFLVLFSAAAAWFVIARFALAGFLPVVGAGGATVALGGSVSDATTIGSSGTQRGGAVTAIATRSGADIVLATVAGRVGRSHPLASTPTMMPATNTTGVRARERQNASAFGRSHAIAARSASTTRRHAGPSQFHARRTVGPRCSASHAYARRSHAVRARYAGVNRRAIGATRSAVQ